MHYKKQRTINHEAIAIKTKYSVENQDLRKGVIQMFNFECKLIGKVKQLT